MPLSRRSFVSALGIAGAASTLPWISARGAEASFGGAALLHGGPKSLRFPADLIRLDSNENPYGPASAAIDAVTRMFGEASRYPDASEDSLRAAIAAKHGVKVESVLLGCGSTEILKLATEALTSPRRALVTAAPTFETPTTTALRMGTPIRAIDVDGAVRLDLDAMLGQARGSGLVFLCNPNNPTGTLHGIGDVKQFIGAVRARSPETYVLVDEAYFEYVDDPAYGTAIPMAIADPQVIVARTFSKVFGIAGLRTGYAIAAPATIEKLNPFRVSNGINVMGATAAVASLGLDAHLSRQQALNREARSFAMQAMSGLGYQVVPSHTNFFLVDIRRDPKAFQTACRSRGLAVGRPFPPLKTHARISIGTMEEMQRAMNIIADVLKAT